MKMNRVWFLILALLVIGSIFKHAFDTPLAWVAIDLTVLFICYIFLKTQPYINLKRSMIFLGGLTAVNITVALKIISGFIGNIIILCLLGWLIFGKQGLNTGGSYPIFRKKHNK
jgi:hypothetical protein